jgi:hypothetical protein
MVEAVSIAATESAQPSGFAEFIDYREQLRVAPHQGLDARPIVLHTPGRGHHSAEASSPWGCPGVAQDAMSEWRLPDIRHPRPFPLVKRPSGMPSSAPPRYTLWECR